MLTYSFCAYLLYYIISIVVVETGQHCIGPVNVDIRL